MEISFYLNQAKKTGEKSPDYRGKVVIDGVNHQLAGWKRNGQYGESISVKLTVDTYTKSEPTPYLGVKNEPIEDEEIPF